MLKRMRKAMWTRRKRLRLDDGRVGGKKEDGVGLKGSEDVWVYRPNQ